MKKQWIHKNPDPVKVNEISGAFGISSVTAAILVNRNMGSLKEVERFLNPDISQLHNPFLLSDIEKAVVRTRAAIDSKEKILVYGDRDADGVTSVALLVRTLKSLGADVVWTIPSIEGYGLHVATLKKYKSEGIKLIITVDCGISAGEEIAYAASVGIDVIITDHHHPGEVLPKAYAIVNPNLDHSNYPLKELAGCATAFKFAYALMFTFNRTFNQEFVVLDLETTGLACPPHEIIEVGAVCIRNFIPVGTFHTLVRPSMPIPEDATNVNGITDAMVRNAPDIKKILPGLIEFIGERTVVAHNAKFDIGFLKGALKENLALPFENPFIDTLALSRGSFSFPSHSLSALVRELKIDTARLHRALDDCHATVAVFKRIEEQRDPRLQFFIEDNLDLVMLGTIADIVPLVDENRTIVKHGLPRLLTTRKVGLKKLLEASRIPAERFSSESKETVPTAREVAWTVTPLINAAGRLAKADVAVKLLLTDQHREASALVDEILQLNRDRKSLQKTNIEKFFRLAQEQCDLEGDKLIFVVAEGMEHGVTGIVASQMMREFQRPVVLLIVNGNEAMGSCRSIPGFSIVNVLEQCKDLLLKHGGHPAAAGLSVELNQLPALRCRLKEIAEREINPEMLSLPLEIDQELRFDAISQELILEMARLEPFGQSNPAPVFSVAGVRVAEKSFIGQGKNHLRLILSEENGTVLNAVGWKMGSLATDIQQGELIDAVFQLELDQWKNQNALQLRLLDIRKSEISVPA